MDKFQRSYRIVVQTETGQTLTITNPLTLDFQIALSNLASLGTGTFKIKNLAQKTRNLIYKDPFTIAFQSLEFYAGYGGNLTRVFTGTVQDASSYRAEGSTDFITQIECNMGAIGTVNNYVADTLSHPTNQVNVINALFRAMAPLQVGYISPRFTRLYSVRPVTLFGDPWKLLKRETGNQCFINNNRIYCMAEGEAIPGSAIVITSASGLLGSPKRYKSTLEAEMVFEPNVQPGTSVEIQSADNSFLNGLYTVTGVEHYGTISDAVGGRLKTKISCVLPAISIQPAINAATSLV